MLHHYLKNDNSGDHWAVSWNGNPLPGKKANVLVQLQEDGQQARVSMTPEQAEYMAEQLFLFARTAREAEPLKID